jgi:hypothetical protein
MSKLQDNQDKKIITPKGICKIVGTKFFSNYKKEIITDEANGKSLLVIYGTGKNKKYITIYDPLYSLQPVPDSIEYPEEDPQESFDREKKYRELLKEESTSEEDIIY